MHINIPSYINVHEYTSILITFSLFLTLANKAAQLSRASQDRYQAGCEANRQALAQTWWDRGEHKSAMLVMENHCEVVVI